LTRKLSSKNSKQTIVDINNLILPKYIKSILKTIAHKILQSVDLSQSESIFRSSFPKSEKLYILTGDSQCTLDFTKYQEAAFLAEGEHNIEEVLPTAAQQPQNLYFDPPTSSEDLDKSEEQEYRLQP
jgi:hypothetical protein